MYFDVLCGVLQVECGDIYFNLNASIAGGKVYWALCEGVRGIHHRSPCCRNRNTSEKSTQPLLLHSWGKELASRTAYFTICCIRPMALRLLNITEEGTLIMEYGCVLSAWGGGEEIT